MGARIGAERREAFLAAYAACGNVTLAAERAGVSRSWVSLTRRAEPEFDSACRSALAEAAARIGAAPDNRPPPGWERSGRAALALVGRKGRAQLVRATWLLWTPAAEARFLAAFEQCCNVKLACQRAGMTVSSYERHRRRWPGFRRRMQAARARGRERIEADLAWEAKTVPTLDDRRIEAAEDMPMLSIKEMIDLVARYRYRRS